jgi:LysR family transcriptional regulator, glycine cleavage system transcriptional activator
MTLRPDVLPALAAFESAARHQNFAHAAEELHLTASAVSHHVRKLESRLGVSLFQRHARGVTLTIEGRQLADAASSALADVDGVVARLRLRKGGQRRLRISTLHSLAYTWLTPRLHRFAEKHPDIRLAIDTEASLTRFDEGGADIALRHGGGHWAGLTSHFVMDDFLFPVASPRLPGIKTVRHAADIATLPLISDLARQGWQDWFRAAGVVGARLDERYSFSDTTDAFQAAAHGLGVALAREKVVLPYLASKQLIRLPGPPVETRWQYYLVYPSHRRLKPEAQAFVDWVLEEAR